LDLASPWRWHASFLLFLEHRTGPTLTSDKGSILLNVEAKHVVLLDVDEEVVDARYLKEGESINSGLVFYFACHKVDIGERILQPDACIKDEFIVTPSQVMSPQVMSILWGFFNV
jgi:hypothetical protein